eukprot:1493560-Prymnesium_polylepis.1
MMCGEEKTRQPKLAGSAVTTEKVAKKAVTSDGGGGLDGGGSGWAVRGQRRPLLSTARLCSLWNGW